MIEVFSEVFAAMRYNKMRIALTGFSIGWGIFLLIVMLGSGNGLLHGITNGFVTNSENIITIKPGTTSIAINGMQKGRKIILTDEDCEQMNKDLCQNVRMMVPELDTLVLINSAKGHCTTTINGYKPGYLITKNQQIIDGRDISTTDVEQKRKVCVLTKELSSILFPQGQAVGQKVKIYDVVFTVIGIVKPLQASDLSKSIYAPFTTVRTLYFRDDRVSQLSFVLDGLETLEANTDFVNKIKLWFVENKNVAASDEKAISITDDFDLYIQVSEILFALQAFVWIVGLATLIAGIVGISNIMLITVKERVRELGVRKAMGASSRSIISLVLCEAIIITLIFGYIGILLGIGLTQFAGMVTESALGANNTIFCDPTVDFNTIIAANVVLLVCGLIAGYVPARKAVSIKLVDALAGVG